MGKKLIITEKPSVARDFARVLNVSGNKSGCIENQEWVISWCYGHLVEMVYPESYDEKYKNWRLEDLPFLPEQYKYGVVESAKEQYGVVNHLLHRDDIDVVYWAGDSGKEGQTIEENIRMYGGVRPGMTELRVWIDSQTDEEILRGIREAKPMSDYARLGKSGIMRTIEDYSLGINFSRALSVKYGRLINDAAATESYTAIALGRVMTCVLGMVVRREREIRNFDETPFYRIVGSFSDANFSGEWKTWEESKYLDSPLLYKENGFKKKEDAENLIRELTGKTAKVCNVEKNISKKKAPLLFNLAELQSECTKQFKISPSETLQIAQDLYERKLTTYPRTDARVLTKAVAKEIHKNLYGIQNFPKTSTFVKEVLNQKKYLGLEKTPYVDDSKVTDHYAIIPTGQVKGIESMDAIHQSVYELIVRRFVAIFYPPAEYTNVKIQVQIEKEKFFTSAKLLKEPGYLKVTGIPSKKNSEDGEDDDNCSKEELLALAEKLTAGEEISVNGFDIKDGKTSPPKRYTSGDLILAMENAGKLIEDEELREQIKNSGIGTSATRGDILEKLVRIKYLNQNKKTQIISPENLGEMIYEVVNLSVPTLLIPEMTASWERGLEGIINGSVDDVEYRKKLEDYIRVETNKMISNDLRDDIARNIYPFTGKDSKGFATRKPLGIPCPECGGELTTTSFGYGCSNYFDKEKNCKFSVGQIAGLDLPEEDFIELIKNGSTKVLDGFVGKNKKKFKAAIMLSKNEEGHFVASFNFDSVPMEELEGEKCPVCGGRIMVTGYGFACENRTAEENPCYFAVGDVASRGLSKEEFLTLLHEGKTPVLDGFKSKNKKPFSAALVLGKNEEGRVVLSFDFNDVLPDYLEGVTCPNCGSKLTNRSGNYGCSAYDASNPDSCKFYIGKIAGKNLTVANVQELLNEGKTKTIRGFKSKAGKKFDACLILKKNEEGKHEIAFDFDNVEAKVIKDIKCPICKGDIVKTSFGYGCSNYDRNNKDSGCNFNIGTIAGVKLNENQVKELLQQGETSTISGFKSKSGSKFEAKLGLDKEENGTVKGIKFIFAVEDEEIENVKCPKCGNKLIKGRFGYRCEKNTREEAACDFRLGTLLGVDVSKEQFIKLIQNGKTDKIAGFTSKKGSVFDACLKLDEEKKIVFDFDSDENNS